MMEVNLYLLVANRGPAKQKAWYGGVLEYETKKSGLQTREDFGQLEDTANRINIRALGILAARLKVPCKIVLHTNNRHLHSVFSNGWLKEWAERGWKNSSDKELKNRELWETAWEILKIHEITTVYETEHSYSNWIRDEIKKRMQKEEDCDNSAKQMAAKMKGETTDESDKD